MAWALCEHVDVYREASHPNNKGSFVPQNLTCLRKYINDIIRLPQPHNLQP